MWSRPAFFQTCPAAHRDGLGNPRPLGGISHACRPSRHLYRSSTVSRSPPCSKSPGITHFFLSLFIYFSFLCIGIMFTTVLFPLFLMFSLAVFLPTANLGGIDGTGDGTQLSGCHRCLGCKVIVANCAKDILSNKLLYCTVYEKIARILKMNFVLHWYFQPYFLGIFHFWRSCDIRGILRI